MSLLFGRLTIEEHEGKRVIFVIFKGLNENEVVLLLNELEEVCVKTRLSFVADFTDIFITTTIMTRGRKFLEVTRHIVEKGAILGSSPVKILMLKALISLYKINYMFFDTKEEAIAFLTEDQNND